MLAFVHIEKTAGTSLIHILRHNYFLQYMDVRPFNKESFGLFTEADIKVAKNLNPFLRAIGGHSVVPYNGLEKAAGGIEYITILRDPVKRYVSQYRHWVEKKNYNISIEQFMENRELWNFQTKKLVGDEDLAAAKRCLREKFIAVGVVEDFDEFLMLLQFAVTDRNLDIRYTVKNTAKDRSIMSDIEKRWGAEIRERNEVDIAVYDFVINELIPEQKSRYTGSFDADLERFSRVNKKGPEMARRYVDYIVRKSYIEPVTGFIRLINGKPYRGSY